MRNSILLAIAFAIILAAHNMEFNELRGADHEAQSQEHRQ